MIEAEKEDMNKKIVIVEDNEIVAGIYKHKLQAEGYHVHIALDGQTGFELINSIKPDMVLLDLMLPGLSGVEIIKMLRGQEEFHDLLIIAFSSSYSGSMVEEARQAKATQVIAKADHTPNQIVEKIKEVLATTTAEPASAPTTGPQNGTPISRQAAEPTAQSQTSKRVLVVEDDPVIRMIVTDTIGKEGYTVVTAEDGREARRILERDAQFVAGIFDVNMPYIEGPDLVRYMRTEQRLMKIPVMMMTANKDLSIQSDSFSAGAVLFIPKPFNRARLQMMFRMLISNAAK